MQHMDWTKIIAVIRSRGYTLEQIKDECGFASKGHVHDVAKGRNPKINWESGDKLLKLHAKAKRRKAFPERAK
jgi:hypothetical protein